jgi:hypothetical protein
MRRDAQEHDGLTLALRSLKHALDEMSLCPARDWVGYMGTELVAIDRAVRYHAARAEGPDGLFAQLQARPTMRRRVARFREDHCRLMVQSAGLRSMTRARALSSAELRVLMRELLIALRRQQADEMDAVFDSVNVDIGAGD